MSAGGIPLCKSANILLFMNAQFCVITRDKFYASVIIKKMELPPLADKRSERRK